LTFTQHVFAVRSHGVVPQSGMPASVNSMFEATRAVDPLEPLLDPEPLLELLPCEPLDPLLLDEFDPELEPVLPPPELEPAPLLCGVDPSSPWSLEASSSGKADGLLLQATRASTAASGARRARQGRACRWMMRVTGCDSSS
jgi:hypothetical protein